MFFDAIPFGGYSPYQLSILFFVWSFLGWIVDVLGVALEEGEYSNRGFLSMPLCPIYGFGVILVTLLLKPIAGNTLLLFLISMVLCTALELGVGLLLLALFHSTWWDYHNEPLNFMGLICLKCSLFWGAACVYVEKWIEPFFEKCIDYLPVSVGMVFICIMTVLIVIDTVDAVSAVIHLNLRLKEITLISKMLYGNSQIIGRTIADTVLSVADTGTETVSKISEKTIESKDKLISRFQTLISSNNRTVIRMIKAFPKLRSIDNREALEYIKSVVLHKSSKKQESEEEKH